LRILSPAMACAACRLLSLARIGPHAERPGFSAIGDPNAAAAGFSVVCDAASPAEGA